MESTLTNSQTYDAVLRFLSRMHSELGWKQLGPLLGSMSLIDGAPMDIALAKDWSEVTELSLHADDRESHVSKLTKEQAYLSMLNFLEKMYDAKREDIEILIRDMTLVDGKPSDHGLVELWKSAIEFGEGGGKATPYAVVKDGLIYQVHRDKPGPKKD